jgi:hypothetical protein
MNTIPTSADLGSPANYQMTRFNALRHGVLSRYTVLPWEDEGEYRNLLNALVTEHAPKGPTEPSRLNFLSRKKAARAASDAKLIGTRDNVQTSLPAHP